MFLAITNLTWAAVLVTLYLATGNPGWLVGLIISVPLGLAGLVVWIRESA